MRRARIRLLTRKAKKVFNISLEIITGYPPNDEKEIRKENIKYIFSNTLHLMEDVIREYDSCTSIIRDQEQAKLITLQKLSMPNEQEKAVEKADMVFGLYGVDAYRLKFKTT
jgi:hypothetical protein